MDFEPAVGEEPASVEEGIKLAVSGIVKLGLLCPWTLPSFVYSHVRSRVCTICMKGVHSCIGKKE